MSKITIAKRIEAAVHATELRRDGYDDESKSGRVVTTHCVYIEGHLKRTPIDIGAVKEDIAAILAADFSMWWRRAWLRFYCARIEAALGLPHGAETRAAIEAKDADDTRAWERYCESFQKKPAAIAEAPAAEASAS